MKRFLQRQRKLQHSIVVSVCGMLKYLDVSRSGYCFWLHRKPSRQEQRRKAVKLRIQQKHAESKKIYGAPKITQELRKEGEKISERTVGKYMRDMGIKAVWSKHWTVTTKDSDFSHRLHNYLMSILIQSGQMQSGARI